MTSPFSKFIDNAEHAVELITLHEKLNDGKRTHHEHEVLTKSCIVLFVACWEAFIEDCAETAVEFLVNEAPSPTKLPKELLKHISSELKADKNDQKIWELCGDGWRQVVRNHYKTMLSKHLGPFNTPRAGNIDTLYKAVLGLEGLSSCWHWKRMPSKTAKEKLSEVITLRGSIAHRVEASRKVTRAYANRAGINFLFLAIKTSNHVRKYIHETTGKYPWDEESVRSIK